MTMSRSLLGVALLLSAMATPISAASATTSTDEVRSRIEKVPGISFVSETTQDVLKGFRALVYKYRQPVDHRNPGKGTFDQRFVLLHRDFERPTVVNTGGYMLFGTGAYRNEPTRLVDGNQVDIEHRYFGQSIPAGKVNPRTLSIWQSATDHHRLITALRKVYGARWISTGHSKAGMSAVYHRRFYPQDVDGTVPYVAPNDVNDRDDSAYARFLDQVGTAECRRRTLAFQREVLRRRNEVRVLFDKAAAEHGYTYRRVRGSDHALELQIAEFAWALWQSGLGATDCDKVPSAGDSAQVLFDYLQKTLDPVASYADQNQQDFLGYYYQAGTQLGWADSPVDRLKDLLKYEYRGARDYVPDDIPMAFQPKAMADIDSWVRTGGNRLLFVYGSNDPWSVERFALGHGTRDSAVHTVPGASHGAVLAGLPATEQAAATAMIRRWAGLSGRTERISAPLPALDRPRPVPPGVFPW